MVSILFLALLCGAIEHVFGNKRGKLPRRPQLGLDLFHAAFNQVLNKLLVGVAVFALGVANALDAQGKFRGFGPMGSVPLWVQCTAAIILGDFMLYWIHRLFHAVGCGPFTRRITAQSSSTWISTFRSHPVNETVGTIFLSAPFLPLGFSPAASFISPALLGLYTILVRADLGWTFRPLRWVLVSPAFHRRHHSKAPEAMDRNFASLLPLGDIIFRTFYFPRDRSPADFGIHEPIAAS